MSHIHILKKNNSGDYQLIFHFAVAGGSNDVPAGAGGPVTWQEAIAASLGGAPVSALPAGDGTKGTISAAEAAEIASGAVFERSCSFPLDSGGVTNAERAASIRACYAQQKTQVTAEIVAQLGYFGAVLDEV